jgi:uncharacterized BrkB/YihY/UPF0761 family membrane protein
MALALEEEVIAVTFNQQLLVGTVMIALCVLVHGFGLFSLERVVRRIYTEERRGRIRPLSWRGNLFTLVMVFALIFLHFVEIWLFALLYAWVNALPNIPDALYFSTISYSTIGYSDAEIAHDWRMIAALEGILGIILLGWSTAFFVRLLGRLEEGSDG